MIEFLIPVRQTNQRRVLCHVEVRDIFAAVKKNLSLAKGETELLTQAPVIRKAMRNIYEYLSSLVPRDDNSQPNINKVEVLIRR